MGHGASPMALFQLILSTASSRFFLFLIILASQSWRPELPPRTSAPTSTRTTGLGKRLPYTTVLATGRRFGSAAGSSREAARDASVCPMHEPPGAGGGGTRTPRRVADAAQPNQTTDDSGQIPAPAGRGGGSETQQQYMHQLTCMDRSH